MRIDLVRALFVTIAVSVLSFPAAGRAEVVVSTMSDPHVRVTPGDEGTADEDRAAALSIQPLSDPALPRSLVPLLSDDRPDLIWHEAGPMAAMDRAAGSYRIGTPAIDYTRSFLDGLAPAKGGAEWECLTEALYFEARGESVEGIFAVAEVILNRVDSRRFPATVCGVVRQGTGQKYKCQFSYRCDGRAEIVREPQAYRRVGKVARLMLDGAPRQLTHGAEFYHTRQVSPRWSRIFDRTTTIGAHHFYAQS